jgi:hypothetical protein
MKNNDKIRALLVAGVAVFFTTVVGTTYLVKVRKQDPVTDAAAVGAEQAQTVAELRDLFNIEFRHACFDTKAAPGTNKCLSDANLKIGACYENEKDAALLAALEKRNEMRRKIRLTGEQMSKLAGEHRGLILEGWVCVWEIGHPKYGIRFGEALKKIGPGSDPK